MSISFRNHSSWTQSFGISAMVHAVGVSSLFAMSVPVVRTLALRQGHIAVETISIVASTSYDSDATSAIELRSEPLAETSEDRQAIEQPSIQARILEHTRTVHPVDSPSQPTIFETPELQVAFKKALPSKQPINDEAIFEMVKPERRDVLRSPLNLSLMDHSLIPLPDLQRSGVVEQPLRVPLKSNAPPKYPLPELQNGIEGRVVLRLIVETDGSVSAVTVETSSGVDGLDRAAVEAVSKWLFEPVEAGFGSSPEILHAPIAFKIAGS